MSKTMLFDQCFFLPIYRSNLPITKFENERDAISDQVEPWNHPDMLEEKTKFEKQLSNIDMRTLHAESCAAFADIAS